MQGPFDRDRTPSSLRYLALFACLALAPACAATDDGHATPDPSPPPAPSAAGTADEGAVPVALAGAPAALNANFEDEDLDVASYLERFEVESREVFAQREHLVDALALEPGEAVADIGSGTGLFSLLFAREVGRDGRVFGVDIAPRFIDLLAERSEGLDLPQIDPVLCTDRSTKLEDDSVDAVFICDTYHHFEHPQDTLASIREALRPGGRMLLVDFHRIPGVTRPWLVQHVRCGREQVIAEVEAAGFTRLPDPWVPGLEENYALLFERP